jgi:hypothetical protein
MPVSCTFGNLAVSSDVLSVAHTFTLQKNGSDTSVACTIASGGTSCSSTNTVAVAAGDLVDYKFNGGAGGNFTVRYSATCQ